MLTQTRKYLLAAEDVLLSLLIFLFPSQMALHFWPSYSFVFGIRVDYLSPAIYLTDAISFLALFFWAAFRRKEFLETIKKRKKVLAVFLALALINLSTSTLFLSSLYRWVKYFLFLLLAIYLARRKKVYLQPLFISSVIFSLIGILQFSVGGTLGGPLYFLGERSFDINTPGIALANLFNREFLRAYSTFSHPNSMAGYLGAVLTLFLFSKKTTRTPFKTLGLLIILAAFLFTFSTTSFFALLAILVIAFLAKYIKLEFLSVGVLFGTLIFSAFQFLYSERIITVGFQKENIVQRLELVSIAKETVKKNLIFGTGFNTFIPNMIDNGQSSKSVWLLQPVHNVPLLLLSEGGVLLAAAFIFAVYYGLRKKSFLKKENVVLTILFILITGTLDHYWLTLQQNNLFLVFIFSFFI